MVPKRPVSDTASLRWPRLASHASFDNGRLCLHHSRPMCVEQASWFCPSVFVAGRLQTTAENSPVILSVLTNCRWLFLANCWSGPWSDFTLTALYKLTFTLHYVYIALWRHIFNKDTSAGRWAKVSQYSILSPYLSSQAYIGRIATSPPLKKITKKIFVGQISGKI